MWALTLYHGISAYLLPLDPQTPTQTRTGPSTNPYIDGSTAIQQTPPKSDITISNLNPSDVPLQANPQPSLFPAQSPRPISPVHFCGDHTCPCDFKYLEQLLESPLATATAIHLSGNTLADVLTPRAHDVLKALHALAALDMSKVASYIPDFSAFFGIRNDHPYPSTSNPDQSPPMPNHRLAVPCACGIHLCISMPCITRMWWAPLVFFFVIISAPQYCNIGDRI